MFDDEFYSTASGFLKSQVMQIPDGQRKLQQSSRNSGEVMRWLHFSAGLTCLSQYLTLVREHFSFHSPEQTSSVVMCTVVG